MKKKTLLIRSRSGIPDSIAIPLSDLQTGNRRLVTSQSILGYPSTQKVTKSKRVDSLETTGKQVLKFLYIKDNNKHLINFKN